MTGYNGELTESASAMRGTTRHDDECLCDCELCQIEWQAQHQLCYNLSAVPVLAEPSASVNTRNLNGEARESTMRDSACESERDSRVGGQPLVEQQVKVFNMIQRYLNCDTTADDLYDTGRLIGIIETEMDKQIREYHRHQAYLDQGHIHT